jgi:hypothetical protein
MGLLVGHARRFAARHPATLHYEPLVGSRTIFASANLADEIRQIPTPERYMGIARRSMDFARQPVGRVGPNALIRRANGEKRLRRSRSTVRIAGTYHEIAVQLHRFR